MVKKKRCTKCGKTREVINFSKDKKTKDGLAIWCRLCKKQSHRNWYLSGGGAHKQWKRSIKRRFGISEQQYKKRLKLQKYKCAICGKSQSVKKKRFAVDHNHKTKFIRGLLCDWCNWYLLRYLKDNKKFATGIVDYLSKALKEDKKWS